MGSPSQGTPCAGVRPRTTHSEEAVYNLPIRGQTVVLRKGLLCPVCLHPDSDVAEAWQTENLLGFWSPRQGY
jgi:hypothetical protein